MNTAKISNFLGLTIEKDVIGGMRSYKIYRKSKKPRWSPLMLEIWRGTYKSWHIRRPYDMTYHKEEVIKWDVY